MEKLLLVDDKRENLLALEGVLRAPDREIVQARSGNEALGLLLSGDFAAVLLDVQMPEMDGFETASLIRGCRQTSQIPIIFLTAIHTEPSYALKGYDLGAIDYLAKPLDPKVVRAKVETYLRLYRERHQLESDNRELEDSNSQLRHHTTELTATLEQCQAISKESETLTYAASHDLKEPLRMVSTYLKLLKRQCEGSLDPRAKELLEFAMNGAIRGQQLVEDLLDYARLSQNEGEKSLISAQEAVQSAVEYLSARITEKGAHISWGDLPDVVADRGQLVRLFLNLIANAIKFQKADAKPEVRIEAVCRPSEWIFSVADNGIGIAPEDLERIFQLFKRLHGRGEFEGSGIGLALCKRIVEHHNGRIWVESSEQGGSRFLFSLPRP